MEDVLTEQQLSTNDAYTYAANLMVHQKKSYGEVIDALNSRGIETANAVTIVDHLQLEIDNLKKAKAKKDILYGALWCIGGTVLTMAHIGFIFWGAIVFGGIQFFRGLINIS